MLLLRVRSTAVLLLATLILLTAPPLWAKTIMKTVNGYDLSFEIPAEYSVPDLDWTKSPDGAIAIGFVVTEGTLEAAMDAFDEQSHARKGDPIVKGYVNSNVGFVTGKPSRNMHLLMAGACQGHCVAKVVIFNDATPQADAEAARLFDRYKAVLVSRKFESANAGVGDQSSSYPANWLVIAGAWADSQKVKDRVAVLRNNGISAHVINTDDYSNLTPGLKAVVLGPTSKDQAQTLLVKVQSIVPDAFIKQGRN